MNARLNHIVWPGSILLLMIAVILSSYLCQPFIIIIPLVLLISVTVIQYPHVLFLLLITTIPWSIEISLYNGISMDFPDEPLMLLSSFWTILYLLQMQKGSWNQLLHPLILIVLLQFFWTVVTVIASTHVAFSVKYLFAKSWYLLSFLIFPVILFDQIIWLKRTAMVLVISTFVVTFVSIIRHSNYGFEFASINDALSPFFRNHVIYSSMLAFVIPIQYAIFKLSNQRVVKNVMVIIISITVVGLLFSYSRGGWLACALGFLSWTLLKRKILVITFATVIVLAGLSMIMLINNDKYLQYSPDFKSTVFHEDFSEHLNATYELKDVSTAERFYRWVAAIRMVPAYWLTGSGPTTFYEEYKNFTVPAFRTWVSSNEERSTVHNYFLLVLVEQGIVGLMMLLGVLFTAFWHAEKAYHRIKQRFWKVIIVSVVSILIMECVVNFMSDLVETDKVGSLFYLCLAVLIIADLKSNNKILYSSPNI